MVLIHNRKALIPRLPYWPWVVLLFAVALFGVVLQLGLEDGLDDPEVGPVGDRAVRWRAAGLAYMLGVLASIVYLVMVELLGRLDGAAV